MISFSAHSYRGLIEIEITIELWKAKEFIWKIINRIYLRLGKGYYFVDCGRCDRVKGKMVCLSFDGDGKDCYCHPEECNEK